MVDLRFFVGKIFNILNTKEEMIIEVAVKTNTRIVIWTVVTFGPIVQPKIPLAQ